MNAKKLFFISFIIVGCAYAQEVTDYDEEAADSLKIEANHDLNRLKSFKTEINNNRIFETEREKALGEYLEDQEKWDLLRERGLRDYRKQKRDLASPTENSPEYQDYLKEVARIQKDYEKSRQALVKTRDRILNTKSAEITKLENDELQLYTLRPRYELRKRSRNKWVGSGSKSGIGGGSSSSSAGYVPPPPISNDYPPSSDFPAAPAPYEGFEELPPPPIYDSNINNGVPYDPSFGGEMSIPPPPPPPPDYDF